MRMTGTVKSGLWPMWVLASALAGCAKAPDRNAAPPPPQLPSPPPAVTPALSNGAPLLPPVAPPPAPPRALRKPVDKPRSDAMHRPATQLPPAPPTTPVTAVPDTPPAAAPAPVVAAPVPPPPAPTPPPPPPPSPPPEAAPPPAPPPLNLTALEQRLRDTHAIGLFTKLSLKNQVDDLLAQFRAVYSRQSNLSMADLHQRYDLLLLKVLSLLQNADPPLAADIAASRNAIWGILSDPKKFAKM